MKKLFILWIPITIGILSTLSSCNKDDLNPEEYKFYCKVDGVEWKRSKEGAFCPGCSPLQSDYYPNGSLLAPPGKLEIIANRTIESQEIRKTIFLYVWGGLHEGSNDLLFGDILIDYEGLCRGKDEYDLDSTYNNQFIVKELDTINKRIIGTFNLRVVSYDCTPPDTIRITEGHFNLNPTWHR